MTDREKAMAWWNSLHPDIRILILLHEMNVRLLALEGIDLTGREIENIWQQLQIK